MIVIDKDFIKTYLESKPGSDYTARVEKSTMVKRHFSDKPDEIFLKKYQPSEPDWAIEYKKENWRAITKTYADKVTAMIAKIFRASDFVVKFEDGSSAATGQTLQDYTELNFPKTKSLLYYVQKIWLMQYLTEPNGVTVILPININKAKNDYWKPFLRQYEACDILHFDEEFILIKEDEDKWLLIDSKDVVRITKTKDKFVDEIIFIHGLGYIPARYNGGKICLEDGEILYESVVAGVCPWWDQALVEECDKNVSIKQHVHPEKAVYGENKCKTCDGVGKKTSFVGLEKTSRTVTCGECQGSGIGTPLTSGFGIHVVRPARGGDAPLPDWAPGKYIEKDLSPLEFLDKDIDKRIVKGLAAVCMEQLSENTSDKTESGIKKAYDWEQTNVYLYNIAVDICQYFLPWCYRVISDYRYGVAGQAMEQKSIDKMQPQINTPQRFDIVGLNDLKTQIADMKTQGVSGDIINELEKQLVAKEFAGDIDTINYLTSVIDLDPLRNFNVEDKSLMYASGAIKLEDFAVSSNIQTLVQKASEETKGFYEMATSEKREIVYSIAKTNKIGQKAVTIPLNVAA